MKDKKFVIDSIKMDLHRIVNAVGDITKEIPEKSVVEFMEHAEKDFKKINLTVREQTLREQLQRLLGQLTSIKDPLMRLRWTEDVLTVRCRL